MDFRYGAEVVSQFRPSLSRWLCVSRAIRSMTKLKRDKETCALVANTAEERVTARKTIEGVDTLILNLLSESTAALQASSGDVILSVTKHWSERTAEMFLGGILGVAGLEALRQAITVSCGKLRNTLLRKFINRVAKIEPALNEEQISTLEQVMNRNCNSLLKTYSLVILMRTF